MATNSILGVFAKSPIKPLEDHINLALDACEGLIPFFHEAYKGNWEDAAKHREIISLKEREADAIKRDIRLSMPTGIFMPVERTDVLELLVQQDKIANKAKDISGRVLGRELPIPEQIQEEFDQYLNRCVDAARQAAKVINELDDLLETGFRGREVDLVAKMIEKLDAIEHDTDKMQISLRRALRDIESHVNPVDVIFLYDIIDWMGELADLAERVGSRLELMLAR